MKFETIINVFEDDIFVGTINAYDTHFKTKKDMNWLFTPQSYQQLGIDDLREIANKMESLEPENV
jgi:hypothetical protein